MGSLSLLQGNFLIQESSLHCRWILYQLSYQGNSFDDWRKLICSHEISGFFDGNKFKALFSVLCGLAQRAYSLRLWVFWSLVPYFRLPSWLTDKSTCQHRRCGFNPWVGKMPGEGNSKPLQYSLLSEPPGKPPNPLQYSYLEIPWTEESGGLQSMGSQESDKT